MSGGRARTFALRGWGAWVALSPALALAGPGQADVSIFVEPQGDSSPAEERWRLTHSEAEPVPPEAWVIPLPPAANLVALANEQDPNFTVDLATKTFRPKRPLSAGTYDVGVRYRLDLDGRVADLSRTVPVELSAVRLISQALPNVDAESSVGLERARRNLDGSSFFLWESGAVPAQTPLRLRLTGLPIEDHTPRLVATALALAILGWMIAMVVRARPAARAVDPLLDPESRRRRTLRALELLEADRASGALDDALYERRRKQLMQTLAGVLREIDVRG